jgi:hypothetical protein
MITKKLRYVTADNIWIVRKQSEYDFELFSENNIYSPELKVPC